MPLPYEREPSPAHTLAWAIWYILILFGLAISNVWLVLVLLLSFFPLEIHGRGEIRKTHRGTFSEINTWLHRRIANHQRVRGWGLVLLGVIAPPFWALFWVIWMLSGYWMFGALVAIPVYIGVFDHILSPHEHG